MILNNIWWWGSRLGALGNVGYPFIAITSRSTQTRTKRLEKKLDGNYTRMLRAILNKSWRQHPTRHQLYGHLPPITKTIQVRRTRHAGHCWRSRDELISDVLLWTPTHGRAKRPARTYIQQLCEDTGCCPEDLPEAMNDREKYKKRDSFEVQTEKNAQQDARTVPGDICNIQHHTTLVLTFLLQLLVEATWPKNHHPIYIPPFQRQCFSFPFDMNWLIA